MLQLLAGKDAGEGKGAVRFERHRPERTLLYQLVEEYYPAFEMQWSAEGRVLPDYVRQELEAYLKCGRLEHGFLRVQCDTCHAEHLVAFSCKRRGFCPSCGARRMAESAALLVDEVLPHKPMRQWVLSVPFPLRFLFASQPRIMGKALGIVYRTIATHLTHKVGYTKTTAHPGAVTLIQRFGSALNLNIRFSIAGYVFQQKRSTAMDDSQEISLTEKQRHWLDHLQACNASSKDIAAYAADQGIDARTLYAGKRC